MRAGDRIHHPNIRCKFPRFILAKVLIRVRFVWRQQQSSGECKLGCLCREAATTPTSCGCRGAYGVCCGGSSSTTASSSSSALSFVDPLDNRYRSGLYLSEVGSSTLMALFGQPACSLNQLTPGACDSVAFNQWMRYFMCVCVCVLDVCMCVCVYVCMFLVS